MEESTSAAFQLTAMSRSWNIPSTSKGSQAFSHLPSVERTYRSSSTFSSHCSTSEAGPEAPLDTVTTSISCCDDNDEKSDVSSVSSGESLEDAPPRSIFSSYWRTKGGAPGSLRRVQAAAAPSADSDDDSASNDSQSHSTNTYERTLYTQEDHHNFPTSIQDKVPHPRRRIFQGLYQSAPELSLVSSTPSHDRLPGDAADSPMRKTRSTSALIRRPSCISRRTRRFSMPERSVSFSPQVKVVVFTPPTEQWASKGWSDYFV